MVKATWIDLTDDLTAKGKELPIGKVLIFDYEGSKTHLKIVRKYKGKVWAKEVNLMTDDEAHERVSIEDVK